MIDAVDLLSSRIAKLEAELVVYRAKFEELEESTWIDPDGLSAREIMSEASAMATSTVLEAEAAATLAGALP